MYDLSHKSVRESKSRKNTQNPSFSSSLLDEIYRSMDAGDHKTGEYSFQNDKLSRKQSISTGGCGGVDGRARARASSAVEDEGIASLRRAFLVQKWIDMKVNAKNITHRKKSSSLPESDRKSVINNDPFLLGGYFHGSERFTEHKLRKPSCFGPTRPKQGKTDVFPKKHLPSDFDYCFNNNQTGRMDHEVLIKSKSRALKIYANLKKVKQPISPGGRLTTFLNSLFTNGHSHLKKPENLKDVKIDRTSKSTNGSTCSSASSFTRSCLSKNSPRSRERLNNGIQRTVRFYPVSVIIDEDCRPCGEKFIFGEQDFMKVKIFNDEEDDDDDYNNDDLTSDTSSDLFELDHLSVLRECEELPVYETTHFRTNRAIANGLIC